MANPVAELFVKISSDIKGLKTGLSQADSQMGRFAAGIQKHHRAIGMAMTAAGGAILAVGVLSVKTFAQMGDEVAKMARKTGFSTEALSELRHAAELSGTDIMGLDKATKRMSKTIVDASEGMTTYIRAFDRIGLSAEELIGLSPEEQFLEIGQAIADLEDPTLRAATAQDIFGRAGMALLPMFDRGSEALAEMRQEAHDLGIVFDEEAAKKAEEMTDAMYRVEATISGLKMTIADTFIPILMPLVEKIKEVVTSVQNWMKENPELARVLTIVVTAIGALMVVLGPLLIMLPGIVTAVGLVGGALAVLTGPIGIAIAAIAALIAIGVMVWKNWDKIKEKAISTWNTIAGFFQEVWNWIAGIFQEHWDKILAVLFPAVGLPILIARNWGKIVGIVKDIWNRVVNWFKGIPKRIGDAFAPVKDFILAPFRAAWSGIESAINWLIRQLNKIQINIPGWVPLIGGKTFGINIAKITLPKFQEGGIVTSPTVALVGEKGPEAIVPLDKMGNTIINFTEPVFMENEGAMDTFVAKIETVLRHRRRLLYGEAVV